MLNPVTSLHSYLKNQSIDSKFFKNIFFIPVVGLIVQIWKSCILHSEIKEIKLDEVHIASAEGLKRYNKCVKKVTHLVNLGAYSYNRGKFADIACIIAGAFCAKTILRLTLTTLGFASLGTRLCILLFVDDGIKATIKAKRPQTAGLEYAVMF